MRIEYLAALIAVFAIVDIFVVVALVRRRRTRTATAETTAMELGMPTNQRKRSAAPVLAIVFLSLGLTLAIAAGICTVFVAQDNSTDSHADGTVIELVPSGHGRSPRYRARVEFTTATGTQVRFLSSVSSNPPPAKLGEHVDIRYDPNDPHDATIDSYWQMWFLPTLLGIIGAPFLIVGSAFGVVSLAGRRRSPAT